MNDNPEELAELVRCRVAIEALDRRIVELLAERFEHGRAAARIKRAAGLPIAQPKREADVIRRACITAAERDLPVDGVQDIFRKIVELSRRIQESTATDA